MLCIDKYKALRLALLKALSSNLPAELMHAAAGSPPVSRREMTLALPAKTLGTLPDCYSPASRHRTAERTQLHPPLSDNDQGNAPLVRLISTCFDATRSRYERALGV